MSATRIAVTGHCGAGKTTIVELLQQYGYNAYSVAQEHSIVRDLWSHQNPDVVVHLDVSLDEIRRRKSNPKWPEWIFDEQARRMASARTNATLIVDTDEQTPEEIAQHIAEHIAHESP